MPDIVICEPIRTPVGARAASSPPSAPPTSPPPPSPSWCAAPASARATSTTSSSATATPAARTRPSAGSPPSTPASASACPALQIDRRCGSGLQAVLYAAGQVATGAARVVVAGGAESMSQVEHYALGCATACAPAPSSWSTASTGPARPPAASTTRSPAGCSRPRRTCAREYAIAREEQDELVGPLPPAGRAPPRSPAASPTSSCRSPSPAAAASPTSSSTATSTRARAPRSSTSRRCARSGCRIDEELHRHRRQRQRPERRRRACASSPPARRPSAAACARCSRSARGPSPASGPR